MEEVYTVGEAAEIAKLAPNSIKNAILRGQLLATNVGGRKRRFWRIPRRELERWLGLVKRESR